MREMFVDRSTWVLSGSLDGWGDALIPCFNLVVFLTTPTNIRLQRLRAREATHFGADAVQPGGWRHQATEEFVEWAGRYDYGDREGRTLARHQIWLAALPCPVLRLEGTRPLPELVAKSPLPRRRLSAPGVRIPRSAPAASTRITSGAQHHAGKRPRPRVAFALETRFRPIAPPATGPRLQPRTSSAPAAIEARPCG